MDLQKKASIADESLGFDPENDWNSYTRGHR